MSDDVTPAFVADLLTRALGYVYVSPHARPAGTRLSIEADRPETAEPGDVHLGIWDGDTRLAAVRMRVEILGGAS